MSRESTKAMTRRLAGEERKYWHLVFHGRGIDVGCGDDPITPFAPDCRTFDRDDGDANVLSSYFPRDHFDFVHASHVLEHMHDPRAALRDWLRVTKPGGRVVVLVPDWVAYEGMVWPSRWNSDHKSSWSMIYRGGAPQHIHIPSYLAEFHAVAEVELCRFVDTNYDYAIGTTIDQTLPSEKAVECWNEFVLRKIK